MYPVYIIHQPILFTLYLFILPLPLPAIVKLIVVLAGVYAISLLLYELILKRVKPLHPFFGLKWE